MDIVGFSLSFGFILVTVIPSTLLLARGIVVLALCAATIATVLTKRGADNGYVRIAACTGMAVALWSCFERLDSVEKQ